LFTNPTGALEYVEINVEAKYFGGRKHRESFSSPELFKLLGELMASLYGRDLLSINDLTTEEIWTIIETARALKNLHKSGVRVRVLEGKTVALMFKKPSTRTRVSFQVAVAQLGGQSFYLRPEEMQLARGETIRDTASVLDRYIDALVIRTFEQEEVEEYAKWMTKPVINALTDLEHPCQILADLLTIWEKKRRLEGLKVAYAGDIWNVAQSWMLAAPKMGIDLYIARPPGYEPHPRILEQATKLAKEYKTKLVVTSDLVEAVKDADVIYANTWFSMGKPEMEKEKRLKDFRPYQINAEVVKHAKEDFIFMHCLPAYWGNEATEDIAYGPHSVIFDQAENRLHAQKAILALILAGGV